MNVAPLTLKFFSVSASRRPFARFGIRMFGALLAAAIACPARSEPHAFTLSGDGLEVTDQQTGLVWRRCPEGMAWDGETCGGSHLALTAQDALQRATAEAARTGLPWRLPNRKELASLVDRRVFNPAIDVSVFPATPSTDFWSSSPVAAEPSSVWSVAFDEGFVLSGSRSFTFAARLVRGGS